MHPSATREPQPGKWLSAALTALMHGLLAVFLFFGVQWQSRSPEPVSVELVRTMPSVQPSAPPTTQPPAPPVEQPAPPPPPPTPKPEVKAPETPPPPKPDIAIKEPKPEKKPPPKPEPKPEPKVEKKPEPKVEKKPEPKPEPKVVEKKPEVKPEPKPPAVRAPTEDDRMRALMNQDSARAQAVTRQNELIRRSQEEVAGNSKALDEWTSRIVAKVRPLVRKPPNLMGRPKAIFNVRLLPDGSVSDITLKSSSGNPTLDAAIERAIAQASPLPLPTRKEVFTNELSLTFDPNNPDGG